MVTPNSNPTQQFPEWQEEAERRHQALIAFIAKDDEFLEEARKRLTVLEAKFDELGW